MALQDLFATKSLEQLHEEMKGENRLRRVLGPVGLTSLGIGDLKPAGALHFSQYEQMIQAAVNGQGVALGRQPFGR